MSTNTLFKPVASNNTQQTPLNNAILNTNTNVTNTTINTTSTSTSTTNNIQPTQPEATFENIASLQKYDVAAQKKNLRYVPPVFFVGGSLKRKDITFSSSEPEISRSASFSFNNNDRRFSSALADLSELHSSKNEIQNQTRIFSKPARPNHGLFGDGSIEKKRKIEKEYKLVKDGSKFIEPKASIEVSGYPHDSENFITQHFSQYGTIKHQVTINNKTIFTFENFHAAISAVQKSDGFEYQGCKFRVKLQAEQTTSESNEWNEPPAFIRLEKSDDLFKITNSSKLGDGTTGFSVLDKNAAPYGIDRPEEGGFITKIKDTFLGF